LRRPQQGRGARSVRGAALCAVLLVPVAGCGSMSPDPADYREQAYLTLGTAVSELATTRLYVEELAQGDVFATSTTSQILASDQSVGSSAQKFGSLNPPLGSDKLYEQCSSLLTDAQDVTAAVRIAVHRGDTGSYPRLVRHLRHLGDRLEQLQTQVQP
jgi:hypothetical protein